MLIPFDRRHVGEMTPTQDGAAGLSTPNAIEKLERLAAFGACETIATDDGRKILGIVAAVPITEETCEVLIMSSVEQKSHPVVFTKAVRAALVKIRPHFVNIRAIGENTPFYTRWFSWLGFKRAGLIERHGLKGKRMMWEMAY